MLDVFRPDRLCLVDVGFGGFLVEGTAPYAVDTINEFLFETLQGDWSIRLQARVVYCHEADIACSLFMAGFAFVNPMAPDVALRIDELIERVLAAGIGLTSGGEIARFLDPHDGLN